MAKAFVTKPAPDFEIESLLPSEEFEKVKLSDYKGKMKNYIPFEEAGSVLMSPFRKIGFKILFLKEDTEIYLMVCILLKNIDPC